MSGYISDQDIIWTNDAGTLRVRAVRDDSPHEPEFDGAMPTLRIDPTSSWDTPRATQVYGSPDYGFDAENAWARIARDRRVSEALEVFTRYLRVFHGTTTTDEYNTGLSREYGYLTFDTAAWAAHQGAATTRLDPADTHAWAVLRELDDTMAREATSPGLAAAAKLTEAETLAACHRLAAVGLAEYRDAEHYRSGWVRTYGAETSFAEYRAYLEGECYGLILERKVALHITRQDLAFPAQDWEEEDAIWGIYTDDKDNAVSSAVYNFSLDTTEGVAP